MCLDFGARQRSPGGKNESGSFDYGPPHSPDEASVHKTPKISNFVSSLWQKRVSKGSKLQPCVLSYPAQFPFGRLRFYTGSENYVDHISQSTNLSSDLSKFEFLLGYCTATSAVNRLTCCFQPAIIKVLSLMQGHKLHLSM